jgi:hypothetical protein
VPSRHRYNGHFLEISPLREQLQPSSPGLLIARPSIDIEALHPKVIFQHAWHGLHSLISFD